MRLIIPLCITTFSFSQEWFITNYEYGKMLYNNPRGISCAKCHGKKAQGKIIASYKIKKYGKIITKTIKAPNIQNITYEQLKTKIFPKKKILSIMPQYDYLTTNEVEALYLYLQAQKDKK
ncbi:c-type cytochrome [Caminibacter sp.]